MAFGANHSTVATSGAPVRQGFEAYIIWWSLTRITEGIIEFTNASTGLLPRGSGLGPALEVCHGVTLASEEELYPEGGPPSG